ncbi:signal peptidase I [Leucobacter coleopterorum]|uniref:Signal peptidase I n=1 Tax=Leucobacter coleopterorum TaxID=2714933 RepID=A0ABX6JY48_9MICO|nr:signal peptidase I [Leucobacter coleopterorum]QIM19226.1 signal peptidase I [Leucobacter coleopterorum]
MKYQQNSARARAGTQARSLGHWSTSPWQIVGRAVMSALVISAVVVLLALVVVPRVMGGDSLTVLSGSMEPTFAPGDVVVVKGTDEVGVCNDVSVGAIVTYFPKANDPALITHRVIGKTIGTFEDHTQCRLITQGDANSSVDEPVSPTQVRGVFMYGIPKLGWARQWVGENPMLALAALVAVLVIAGGWSATRKPRTTVITAPRQGSGMMKQTSTTASAKPDVGVVRDRELHDRELKLRERELELRERELAHAIARSASATDEAAVTAIQRVKE